ncbi:uncharacterized protein METZ01_LOCUS268716 [marine metagenome]|uniref:FCP1 homology domain-containing protein n=1 Tax=marine metagenome TaxID=408172 RepID=A0A382JWZ7_9ZZZZ
MISTSLDHEVLNQIESLDLNKDQPLLISDADEVILNFVRTFETYLNNIGLYYDLSSYALFGNIKKIEKNIPIANDEIIKHITNFYNLHTEEISFVDESVECLKRIDNDLGIQIIILSNLPHHNREKREISFKNNGLNFPIISNSGLKGLAVKQIAKKQENKIFFIDDISANLLSAYNEVDGIKLIHYISDERLEKLASTPKEINFKAKNWKEIYNYLEDETS